MQGITDVADGVKAYRSCRTEQIITIEVPEAPELGLRMHHEGICPCEAFGGVEKFRKRVRDEHYGVRTMAKEFLGVTVNHIDNPRAKYGFDTSKLSDIFFAQDQALILADLLNGLPPEAFIFPMGALSRRPEVELVERFIRTSQQNIAINALYRDANDTETMDGGDFIVINGVILAGTRHSNFKRGAPTRTTYSGINRLRPHAERLGYQILVMHHCALHITSTMSYVGRVEEDAPHTFLVNVGTFPELHTQFAALERTLGESVQIVQVDAKEGWAANALAHRGKVLIQAGNPNLKRTLKNLGFLVEDTPFDAIRHLDGGMTCLEIEVPTWLQTH